MNKNIPFVKKFIYIFVAVALMLSVVFVPFSAQKTVSADSLYSVDFNQIATLRNTPPYPGVSIEFLDNGIYRFSGVSTASKVFVFTVAPITNHFYFVSYEFWGDSASSLFSYFISDRFVQVPRNSSVISQCLTSAPNSFYIYVSAGVSTNCDCRFMVIDLTQMFGSGYEPSTVAEFRSMYPDNYYDYVISDWQVALNGYQTAYAGIDNVNILNSTVDFYDSTMNIISDNTDSVVSAYYSNGAFTYIGIALLFLLGITLFLLLIVLVKKLIMRGE